MTEAARNEVDAAKAATEEPPKSLPELLERQTEQVGHLTNATTALAEVILNSERSRRRDRVVYIVLIFVILLVTVPSTITVFQTRQTQKSGRSQATSQAQIQAQIADCLLPTGTCYKRSQANIANAVAHAIDADRNGKVDVTELEARIDEILQEVEQINANR